MKKTLIAALLLIGALFSTDVVGQNAKFMQAMEKNLAMLDSIQMPDELMNKASQFIRIAMAEPNEWLPSYYAAYCQIMATTRAKGTEKLDEWLDEADKNLEEGLKRKPNESELLTLKAMASFMRMRVNPMERWQKYGGISQEYLAKAKEADPTNPRPWMLQGQSVLFTPEQFGGGKDKAMPILNTAMDKFNAFKPASKIHPNWGKAYCESLMK